jgi:hypothetical protein
VQETDVAEGVGFEKRENLVTLRMAELLLVSCQGGSLSNPTTVEFEFLARYGNLSDNAHTWLSLYDSLSSSDNHVDQRIEFNSKQSPSMVYLVRSSQT